MTDESDGDMSWDHLTQQEINNKIDKSSTDLLLKY